jgi:hypothetical protein
MTLGNFPSLPFGAITNAAWTAWVGKFLPWVNQLVAMINAAFGPGQTWQNMTSSRSLGNSFTNTTSRPMVAKVTVDCVGAAYMAVEEYINGVVIATDVVYTSTAGNYYTISNLIIPPGAVYSVSASVNTGSLAPYSWWELR